MWPGEALKRTGKKQFMALEGSVRGKNRRSERRAGVCRVV